MGSIRDVLLAGNANLVELLGLKNNATGSYRNSLATVNVQLLELDGSTIDSPVTAAYVAGSNGNYRATIAKSVTDALTIGTNYIVHIWEVGTSGLELDIKLRRQLVERTR
jgi:hypothetical protein